MFILPFICGDGFGVRRMSGGVGEGMVMRVCRSGFRHALLASTVLAGSMLSANAGTVTIFKGSSGASWNASADWTAGLPTGSIEADFTSAVTAKLASSGAAQALLSTISGSAVDLNGHTLSLAVETRSPSSVPSSESSDNAP